eukprot:CAMPEP_0184320856 /NCGR_PEP_ID=MMETSP1049-20130417/116158_1 /TAXON_ID=77928 /ORGANISM="Proteomonas sulcata, Strain CCMP704" /LENGTH=92 /DNA_ID=CAMNT_0026641481 /DNA_START=50 /DNA_END=328 /DNA_ORIENTATION=-
MGVIKSERDEKRMKEQLKNHSIRVAQDGTVSIQDPMRSLHLESDQPQLQDMNKLAESGDISRTQLLEAVRQKQISMAEERRQHEALSSRNKG